MTGGSSWPLVAATFARWFPQLWLAVAGLAALALVPVGALWATLDGRLVADEVVALKPTRFALSIGVYLLTASWMLGYARPERLSTPLFQGAVWGLLVGAGVELFCIVLQAARGRRSHLNLATPLDATISGIMLVMALLFIGMVLPIAWEIARRPRPDAPPLMVSAIVAGLVATFILGALTGSGMGRLASGAVTADVVRLPLLGSVRGGSLRIAHFLAVHAMQAFPLIAATALMLPGRATAVVLVAGAVLYAGVTLTLWSRATTRIDRSAVITSAVGARS